MMCDGVHGMSPTLLELTVAIVLLLSAWPIGTRLAPYVFTFFAWLWRDPALPPDPDPDCWPPEKNVTPPGTMPDAPTSRQTHDRPSK